MHGIHPGTGSSTVVCCAVQCSSSSKKQPVRWQCQGVAEYSPACLHCPYPHRATPAAGLNPIDCPTICEGRPEPGESSDSARMHKHLRSHPSREEDGRHSHPTGCHKGTECVPDPIGPRWTASPPFHWKASLENHTEAAVYPNCERTNETEQYGRIVCKCSVSTWSVGSAPRFGVIFVDNVITFFCHKSFSSQIIHGRICFLDTWDPGIGPSPSLSLRSSLLASPVSGSVRCGTQWNRNAAMEWRALRWRLRGGTVLVCDFRKVMA